MLKALNADVKELEFKKSRNYGIDALRVLSAVMIVMLHVLSQGGVLANCEDLTFKGEFLWWMQIGCLSSVNIFALISGYVGINSKHKTSNILTLWLQVFLYNLISKIIVLVFFDKTFSFLSFVKSFFPVITSENWYFSAYFILFFFFPLLNELIQKIEKTTIEKCLLFSVFLFMIVETISSVEVVGLRAGYSVLWLALLYVIGAYIRKYDPLKRLTSWQCVLGIISCMTLTLLSKLLVEIGTLILLGESGYGTKFLAYTSPIMVLQAVFFLQLFSTMNFPKLLKKFIAGFAPVSFGVYIIHTATAFYRYILRDGLSFVSEYSLIATLGVVIGVTIVIWLACSVIDFVRIFLFKFMRVDKLTRWFGTKIDNFLDKALKNNRMEK